MEESQTTYDDDGTVIMQAVVQRFHDDFGATPTTGALDTNADSDDLQYTAANLEGRIQITAMWYDDTGRLQDTVLYGTNGGSNFDRDALSVPTRSATKLRTTRVYHDSGQLKSVEDPREIVTYFEYDDAGRRTKEVRNYDASVNSGNPSGTDDNVTVKYEFVNGLRTKIIADMPSGTPDQETLYIYGTTDGTPSVSEVTTGHLLRATVYPDSTNSGTTEANINSDDSDVVSFAYNAQGQQVYRKDQAGNVIETELDDSGKATHRRVSTLDADFDGAVRRISTTYDSLGRHELVTQYDNAIVGSGSVVDEVKFTYEGWGNVSKFEQDINSAVGAGGSVDDYEVSYTYAKAGTTGRNTIRLDEFTLPSGNVITCKYRGNTTDRHDTYLSRVTTLDDGATVLVAYEYLGMGRVVGTDYFAADLESDVHGATSGSYPDLDDFNRITTNKWTRDLATDINFYEIDISYDENSSITLIEDNIHSGFDVDYTIDDLNRLTQAEEGTWGGSSITTTTREQEWTLDHVGNWDVEKLDLDGDGNYTGADEWNDDRTHSDVNEVTGRDTDDNGSDDFTLSYDENGNLTDDGEEYKYEWGPFGRLRRVLDSSDDSVVAEYKYNGFGYRISEHADTDDDGDVDSADLVYSYAYSTAWQPLATFRGGDAEPKEEFVYHLAGSGPRASSYVDSIVLRYRDADTSWLDEADGVMEELVYYCQNYRADVAVLIEDSGSAVCLEWDKYSPYGTPIGLPGGDANSDGYCDASDLAQVDAWIAAVVYDVRGDADLDGDVDAADRSTISLVHSGKALGRGCLSAAAVTNKLGFGGRPHTGLGSIDVRYRLANPELGRWIQRDPIEYSDSPNLYLQLRSQPVASIDFSGLYTFRWEWIFDQVLPCSASYGSTSPNDTFGAQLQCGYIGRHQPWVGATGGALWLMGGFIIGVFGQAPLGYIVNENFKLGVSCGCLDDFGFAQGAPCETWRSINYEYAAVEYGQSLFDRIVMGATTKRCSAPRGSERLTQTTKFYEATVQGVTDAFSHDVETGNDSSRGPVSPGTAHHEACGGGAGPYWSYTPTALWELASPASIQVRVHNVSWDCCEYPGHAEGGCN